MKKLFVCFTIFAFFQVNAQVEITPGVKGGLNFSRFTNTEGSRVTDFYLGGLVSFKFAKFYTLQPEIQYTKQGGNVEWSQYDWDGTILAQGENQYTTDYISLNIINKFFIGDNFHLAIGPALDFKVNDNFDSYYSDDLIDLDFAFVGGIGYTLENGLTFEARFKQGMIDIFGNNYNEYNDYNNNGNYDEVILNQIFQVGVSYNFKQ